MSFAKTTKKEKRIKQEKKDKRNPGFSMMMMVVLLTASSNTSLDRNCLLFHYELFFAALLTRSVGVKRQKTFFGTKNISKFTNFSPFIIIKNRRTNWHKDRSLVGEEWAKRREKLSFHSWLVSFNHNHLSLQSQSFFHGQLVKKV